MTISDQSPPAGSDAQVIALCEKFFPLAQAWHQSFDIIPDDDERDEVLEPLLEQMSEISDEIYALPRPRSLPALQAIGRAIALDHPDDFNDPEKIAAGQINFVLAAVLFEALAPGMMQSA